MHLQAVGQAGGHGEGAPTSQSFHRIQSTHGLWSQIKSSPVQASYKNETNVVSPLCVLQWGNVVYGHRSGSTVCAELLEAVFLHAAQLGPGELEGVLEGWVGVAHAAGHGGDPQVIHWHVALTRGWPHLLSGFGTGGSQDPRYVSPSGNK